MVIKSPATLARTETERVIATQLAEALPIKDMDIARSFGMHPVSLSRDSRRGEADLRGGANAEEAGTEGAGKLTASWRSRFVS